MEAGKEEEEEAVEQVALPPGDHRAWNIAFAVWLDEFANERNLHRMMGYSHRFVTDSGFSEGEKLVGARGDTDLLLRLAAEWVQRVDQFAIRETAGPWNPFAVLELAANLPMRHVFYIRTWRFLGPDIDNMSITAVFREAQREATRRKRMNLNYIANMRRDQWAEYQSWTNHYDSWVKYIEESVERVARYIGFDVSVVWRGLDLIGQRDWPMHGEEFGPRVTATYLTGRRPGAAPDDEGFTMEERIATAKLLMAAINFAWRASIRDRGLSSERVMALRRGPFRDPAYPYPMARESLARIAPAHVQLGDLELREIVHRLIRPYLLLPKAWFDDFPHRRAEFAGTLAGVYREYLSQGKVPRISFGSIGGVDERMRLGQGLSDIASRLELQPDEMMEVLGTLTVSDMPTLVQIAEQGALAARFMDDARRIRQQRGRVRGRAEGRGLRRAEPSAGVRRGETTGYSPPQRRTRLGARLCVA